MAKRSKKDITTDIVTGKPFDSAHWKFKDHLVVVTRYPSKDDLYNYAFVHARVKAYLAAGLGVDVFKLDEQQKKPTWEIFEGVRVITGDGHALDDFIKAQHPKSISCHLLKPSVWQWLVPFSTTVPIYIWLHGAEVQSWIRRSFEYTNTRKRLWAVNLSRQNYGFWRRLLKDTERTTHFIFVSQYFADEVMNDLGITIDEKRYTIIHNFIDTELFKYEKKSRDQRTKIVSIRPFSGIKYANDVTVSTILELSKQPFFEKLHFTIVGDGELFDDITSPLKQFSNVVLRKTFLTQTEISALYHDNGIVLIPSRMDAQGVSRDEAMSSGLVPITNGVTGIPEFVSDKEGFLLPDEDHVGMAHAIHKLYDNPDLFLRMSAAAAKRVRRQSGYKQTLEKEIELLKSGHIRKQKSQSPTHVFRDELSPREKILMTALYEVISDKDKKINKLKAANASLQNSMTMRFGKKVLGPPKAVYRHRVLGLPFRAVDTIVRQNSKEIINGKRVTFGSIPKTPKAHKFYLENLDRPDNKNIKVAAIMDEFTYTSFAPECRIFQLSPDNWQKEIDKFKPDILFVESAWRGKDDKWRYKISNCTIELRELVRYCQKSNIPTMFWNKEDPAHTATLMRTAAIFDFVFTTDADVIPIYRHVLAHNRIHLLPFAAQASLNNPVEEFKRKDKVNFAGSYYRIYKERCRDFETIVDSLTQVKDMDIYDRNHGLGRGKRYEFTERYKPYIIGSLPFGEINKAYKGYKYAITMNTIKYSSTMFARRAFELLASNTITVSNFSIGIKRMLGDLVVSSGDGNQILSDFASITSDIRTEHKYRLLGLRRVMSQHTYEERLDHILKTIFTNYKEPQNVRPSVLVLSWVNKLDDASIVIKDFKTQKYQNKKLVLLSDKPIDIPELDNNIKFVMVGDKTNYSLDKIIGSATYISVFSPSSYYGPNYIFDLSLATKYSDAKVFGKSAYYVTGHHVKGDGTQYHKNVSINVTMGMVRRDVAKVNTIDDLVSLTRSKKIYKTNTLSVDEFNYCSTNKITAKQKREINGDMDINMGENIIDTYRYADAISNNRLSLMTIKLLKSTRLRRTKLPPKL